MSCPGLALPPGLHRQPPATRQAEADHRGHAVIEQLFADLIDGPLAHLPSGRFGANATWLACAAIAHNLTRVAGALAASSTPKPRGATIRRHLINIPARIARSARKITLHLPERWPWQIRFGNLFTATRGPCATLTHHPHAPPPPNQPPAPIPDPAQP